MADSDFTTVWSHLLHKPSMSALRPSTLAQYRSVARHMHDVGVLLHSEYRMDGTTLTALKAKLSQRQMCIAQALLNTHCKTIGVLSCGEWRHQKEPRPPPVTWQHFVPRRVQCANNFEYYSEGLTAFVALHRPEVRLANNIRHRVSLLWSVLVTMEDCGSNWRTIDRQQVVHSAQRVLAGGSTPASLLIAVLNRFLCLLVHPFHPIRHWEVGAKLGPCKPLRLNAGANMPGGVGFQQHHISQLKKVAFVSSYNHLLVTLLSQTGLRRRAVAWLRTECVFDHENGCVRSIGMAVEKHLSVRHFPIGPELRACLERYLNENSRRCTHWLFPSKADSTKHTSPCTIQRTVRRLCAMAGVESPTGTRGFRKWVVTALMDHGNTIEYVSKWIGHKRVATTYAHYWAVSSKDAIITRPKPT